MQQRNKGLSNRAVGSLKENLAVEYLLENGFEILDRNYYNRHGEIDIIAKKNEIVSFVEVKYRKNILSGRPEEAVSVKKQIKISKTAHYYIYTHNMYNKYQFSFDVLAIEGENIRYTPNAFDFALTDCF